MAEVTKTGPEHLVIPLVTDEKFFSCQKSKISKQIFIVLIILCSLCYRFSYKLFSSLGDAIPQDGLIIATNSSIPPSEIFEVSMPLPDFGKPVYSQVLVSHVFGNSWGKPAIVNYSAPPQDISFNKVILRLNTSVSGVQYDRLAHLYLDGIALWRTSTIEPGGKKVYSTAVKDVSLYSKIFAQDGIPLMFQLDNLMTKRLTGAFNITLEATYYNAPQNISIVPKDFDDELSAPGSIKNFFGNSDPADKIWSLVSASSPNRPPLIYQPSAKLASKLPIFNANTTRAKLELFMSGNAAEEFWYSNVMDDVKDSFAKHNHPLLGHGPCRIANIYLNEMKIATLAPEPVIYTGGISPALWRPVVGSGAFDVRALEIELTPLLPLLWGHSSNDLKVEVGNCVDDDIKFGKKSSIGENWITTANVLTWESAEVESSNGALVGNFNETDTNVLEIGGGGLSSTLTQIVTSNYKTYVQGELNYNLKNGSSINVISDCLTSMYLSNIQTYSQYGDKQDVILSSTSHHSFSLSDAKNLSLVSQTNITHHFPLVASILTKPIGRDISYDVTLVKGSHAFVKFSNSSTASIKISSTQNGTSHYYLSPKGNHGTGKTEHRFKAITKSPLPIASFKRHVIASGGEVVKDHSKWNDINDVDNDSIHNIDNLQVKNHDHWTIYDKISNHFQKLYDEDLLDFSTFEYMNSHLIKSLNDDFGISSIQSNWDGVDKKLIPHMGLFQHFI